MSLSAAFGKGGYTVKKETDAVLSVQYKAGGYDNQLLYDFVARILITRTKGHGDGGLCVTPFAQLDRETLIDMRDKLIELKGNPPELPPEAPATQALAKKLNL